MNPSREKKSNVQRGSPAVCPPDSSACSELAAPAVAAPAIALAVPALDGMTVPDDVTGVPELAPAAETGSPVPDDIVVPVAMAGMPVPDDIVVPVAMAGIPVPDDIVVPVAMTGMPVGDAPLPDNGMPVPDDGIPVPDDGMPVGTAAVRGMAWGITAAALGGGTGKRGTYGRKLEALRSVRLGNLTPSADHEAK